jgi:4'-phosphopantetheinyl transferase
LAGQKDSGGIHFSASQSDAFAAFTFSRIGSTGVDIEKIRNIPDMLEIIERHFTSREKHEIFSCPEDQRLILFYRFWTRKEAVLKAQGGGLLKALDSVDVAASNDVSRPWKALVRGGPVAEEFWVMDVNGPEGFATAVASGSPLDETSITELGSKTIHERIATYHRSM